MIPKLSVIIPAYNYAKSIERAINSVQNQITNEVELIVVNDGSTDETREILDNMEKVGECKFSIFHKSNGGAASARNFGIQKSSGQYLLFLDADDEMADGAISEIFAFIKTHPATEFIIGGHQSLLDNQPHKIHLPKSLPKDPYDRVKNYLIDKKLSLSNGACVLHRSIFERVTYPEHFRNSEDIPIFTYVLANCKCAVLNVVLAKIHKHNDSLRHNLIHTENVGAKLIEEVFNPLLLPNNILKLKKYFAAQRFLSLSRVAFNSKEYEKSKGYFLKAFSIRWVVIFKLSYTKKIIKAYLNTL